MKDIIGGYYGGSSKASPNDMPINNKLAYTLWEVSKELLDIPYVLEPKELIILLTLVLEK